ncbi:MAG: hypothetical protein HYT85_12355, partial [candidate division NC10 bacterium]|nr:hypothetical protein [candidate division NC10 bacterium]
LREQVTHWEAPTSPGARNVPCSVPCSLCSLFRPCSVPCSMSPVPLQYRAVLVLRDVEGLSNEEVAEAVGDSVAAVKSRVHRARLVLREELTRHLGPRQALAR